MSTIDSRFGHASISYLSSGLQVIFLYCPKSGSRVLKEKAHPEIVSVTWMNTCHTIVGGFSFGVHAQGAPRGNAARLARAVVDALGGVAWDSYGDVWVTVPRRSVPRALSMMEGSFGPSIDRNLDCESVRWVSAGIGHLGGDSLQLVVNQPEDISISPTLRVTVSGDVTRYSNFRPATTGVEVVVSFYRGSSYIGEEKLWYKGESPLDVVGGIEMPPTIRESLERGEVPLGFLSTDPISREAEEEARSRFQGHYDLEMETPVVSLGDLVRRIRYCDRKRSLLDVILQNWEDKGRFVPPPPPTPMTEESVAKAIREGRVPDGLKASDTLDASSVIRSGACQEGVDSWVEAHGNRRQWTLEDLVKVLQGPPDPEDDPVPHVARAILRGGISSTELGV